MNCGRDLRNKVLLYKDEIYAIGGNKYNAEKYDLKS